jgi:hypothetical protein
MRGRRSYTGDRCIPNSVHYLYGGYPGANFGDELIQSTVEGLLSPAHCVFTGRFVPPVERFLFLLKKRKVSAIVLGGGTISPNVVSRDCRLGKAVLPLFAFGLGHNALAEFDTRNAAEAHYDSWKRFVDRCDIRIFGVRGPRSLEKFSEFVPQATITGDTALAAFDVLGTRDKKCIAVNFGQHRLQLTPEKLKSYASLIVELGRLGLPLLFIPLHSADCDCLRAVLKVPGIRWPKSLTCLQNIPSEMQLRGLLPRIAFGVGERLHFSIPLIASGIPSIILAYADKHHDFAESVHAEEYVVSGDSEVCGEVLSKANAVLSHNAIVNDKIIQAIETHKRVLLDYFDDTCLQIINSQ